MAVCLMAPFIASGFIAPIGLLIGPLAETLGIEITRAASLFSFFTAGIFVGYFASFFVFDFLRMKSIFVAGNVAFAVTVYAMHSASDVYLISLALFASGFMCSVLTVAAGTIIGQLFSGKTRQAMLVLQDVMFNGAGIIFTAAASYLLVRGHGWTGAYVIAAILASAVAGLASTVSATSQEASDDRSNESTEWNMGIVLVGVSLLLFMTAKLVILVWAPQFVEQSFGVGPETSGRIIQNIFVAALVGAVVGSYIASRIAIQYLITALLVVGLYSVWRMGNATELNTVLFAGYLYGISVSATFNAYVALGLSFVGAPNHRNVAYLLMAGGTGAAIGPYASARVVDSTGSVSSVMTLTIGILSAVLLSLLVVGMLKRTQENRVLTKSTSI